MGWQLAADWHMWACTCPAAVAIPCFPHLSNDGVLFGTLIVNDSNLQDLVLDFDEEKCRGKDMYFGSEATDLPLVLAAAGGSCPQLRSLAVQGHRRGAYFRFLNE